VVGRSGRRSSPSFTPLIVIPVDTLFELLDRFMQEAALIVPLSELKDATNWSALQDLAMTGMSLDQELHTRGLL
jgi:hypothetical protein